MTWTSPRVAVFEPWSLGDAIIAASVSRVIKREATLFVSKHFQSLIEAILRDYCHIQVVGLDLDYTARGNGRAFLKTIKTLDAVADTFSDVHSIRGDFRDQLAIKKLFPGARVHVQGYLGFFARRIRPLDRALVALKIPPRNRYALWTQCLNVNAENWRGLYVMRPPTFDRTPRILIHIGAQWRSRAYPQALDLCMQLRAKGYDASIGYGPGDPVPQTDMPCSLLNSDNVIAELTAHDLVIVNDSSAMHLAAFLGCRVLALANVSNLGEWQPPHIFHLDAASMPLGYRPKPQYMRDEILDDWPTLEVVLQKTVALVSQTGTRFP